MTGYYPLLVVAISDFNARPSSWCINNKSNYEWSKIDRLASEIYYLLETFSSCTDLSFTIQPNLVIDASVSLSLHANDHHQIHYTKN